MDLCPYSRTAEQYEAEREAAIERSGLDDARERQYLAGIEIEKLAFEAFEINLVQWPVRLSSPESSTPVRLCFLRVVGVRMATPGLV